MGRERQPGSPPDRVWLQWYGDGEPGESQHDPAEVTWSETPVFEHDIEYRRYDPADDPRVLRRAVEIMHEHGNLRWDVAEWIEIAREKLESEGRDGQ